VKLKALTMADRVPVRVTEPLHERHAIYYTSFK